MIVISREAGQAIVIDGTIRIQIVTIRGDKVRVGIEAPMELRQKVVSKEFIQPPYGDPEGDD